MDWKIALVTHGILVLGLVAIWIGYAVRLHQSRRKIDRILVELNVQRNRADKAEGMLATCERRLALKGMSDADLSDAVHDALRGTVSDDCDTEPG